MCGLNSSPRRATSFFRTQLRFMLLTLTLHLHFQPIASALLLKCFRLLQVHDINPKNAEFIQKHFCKRIASDVDQRERENKREIILILKEREKDHGERTVFEKKASMGGGGTPLQSRGKIFYKAGFTPLKMATFFRCLWRCRQNLTLPKIVPDHRVAIFWDPTVPGGWLRG